MANTVNQKAFAKALVEPATTAPAGLTTARGAPDAERFAVYRNNVLAGLGKALESRFPVTRRLVGDNFFRGMARAFIARSRPRSPLLMEYGDNLPDFIAAFEPAASVPYLSYVARLEACWSRAYHAAEAVPIAVTSLAGIAAVALPNVRLEPHPSASLVRSAWPVGSIWAAHQKAEVEPVGYSRSEAVLVVRPQAEVTVHILPAQDAEFADALLGGAALGEAAERASAVAGFDFGTALVGLIGLGAFTKIIIPASGAGA